MAKSITSANAVLTLAVDSVFNTPQRLQGFAADDIYDTDTIDPAETVMGVDGVLSAGFVYVPVKQNFALQADSPSISLFDQWYAAQQAAVDIFRASGVIRLPAVGKSYTMNGGVLTGYKSMPDGKKILQPQRFSITWASIVPAPV